MENVFVTVDLEEWYHLDYLKTYNIDKDGVETVPQILNFLNLLDKLEIKATFFVLAELVDKYRKVIDEISRRGHEIACHGLDHDLLYNKTDDEFRSQVIEAKKILDDVIGGTGIKGFRASCFSMDRGKLDILHQCGYRYDSSYIRFVQHPLYGKLDLTGFDKADDLFYQRNGFCEFEIPTLKLFKFHIPISGGGYLRLFPYCLIKILIKKYTKEHSNFLLYLHPFELTNIRLPIPKSVSLGHRLRASIGRKGNIRKLERVLLLLRKLGAQFYTIDQYCANSQFSLLRALGGD